MTTLNTPQGLREIAADYDVLLCDVWGVVHNGREAFPEACEALTRFNEAGGQVVLISNSPRPRPGMIDQMDQLGVPRSAWKAVVTSGDATRAEIERRAPGPVLAIGPDRDLPFYEGTGVVLTPVREDAAFIASTGLYDDEVEEPECYRNMLTPLAARGLDFVCANPDRVVQRGDTLIWCAGAIADLYAELGGPVIMSGKPHAPIYDQAIREAEALLGRPVDRSRVLCIGDGVITDVLGANNQGLDCLFIAAGIHGEKARGADGRIDAGKAAALLAEEDTHARHAMIDLVW